MQMEAYYISTVRVDPRGRELIRNRDIQQSVDTEAMRVSLSKVNAMLEDMTRFFVIMGLDPGEQLESWLRISEH